jgi:hypothetical protein
MNRLFGRGKPKEPPPNLNDVISGVSETKIIIQGGYIWSNLEIMYVIIFYALI